MNAQLELASKFKLICRITMKSLVFRYSLPRLAGATILGRFSKRAYFHPISPLALMDMPKPTLRDEKWLIVRTVLAGICGSDVKEVFLHGNRDNPITALISFPAVLGHEITGVVESVGAGVTRHRVGERVVINPWLSCAPRGIEPVCPACAEGNYCFCENFTSGHMARGIHLGNSKDAPGGFAPLVAAHESQCFSIPEGVSFEQAVLVDPFSVALHAVLKAPPPAHNSTAIVYGMGTIGLLSVMLLKAVYPSVRVIAIARYAHQQRFAREFGADEVITATRDADIIERV
ncbi:MAG: hypothetical protein FJ025_03940, partial [Chloroflexi bacterium]|nr:hypothetical protein [Chloroflexota bacterium]